MNLRILPLIALFATPMVAQADIIGVRAGVGMWDINPEGFVRDQGTAIDVDLENDLSLADNDDVYFWAAFEHPVPLLPNIKLQSSTIDTTGSGTVSQSFNFGGQSFAISTPVDSEVNIDQLDITLYYEILDNWLNADVGINIKSIDGFIQIISLSGTAREEFDEYLPMLYVNARFDFPTTDLSLGTTISYAGYDGSSLTDLKATLTYSIITLVKIEAGYWTVNFELDDVDGLDMEADFGGPFAGLSVNF